MARKARTWKGARTPQALKRDRQAQHRRAVNRRARSEARTLVQRATNIALGYEEGNGPEAIAAAVSALDRAAEKGVLHPNNAARRKSRLMLKANAAHLIDDTAESGDRAPRRRSAATKTAQRKKVAAAKASKAAAAKAADRPRTAAGKAKVAVTRASRSSKATRKASGSASGDEAPEASTED